LRWLIYLLIGLFVIGFTALQTGINWEALIFPVVIGIGLLTLFGMAKLLMFLVKKFFPHKWSYVWRQSIANLYRPNNQTIILMIAIGLGTGLISTMYFTREMLLQEVELSSGKNQPNFFMFNIQKEQIADVTELVKANDLPIMSSLPIARVRINAIDSLSTRAILRDTTSDIPSFLLERELEVSYRNELMDNEKIKEGKWHTKLEADSTVYVSLDTRLARRLNVEVDNEITFLVGDDELKTTVGSIRLVKDDPMKPNLGIIFPEGTIDDAPQFNIILSRTDSAQQVTNFQRVVAESFPGINLLDVRQILKTIDRILGKIAFVIRFMALFSILTGIIVLISSVVLSKYQRIQESVLLRTLGASQRQILWINALEYCLLGGLAALTGMLLSIIGSFFLAKYGFQIDFTPNWWPPILRFLGITVLTVIIGLLNSREVLVKPPLEVLRKEV